MSAAASAPPLIPATLDRSIFTTTENHVALKVPSRLTSQLLQHFRKNLAKRTHPVTPDPNDPQAKLVALEYKTESEIPQASLDIIKSFSEQGVALTTKTVESGYDQISAEEALRRILPEHIPLLTSFEAAGHIAHMNLRAHHLPYRHLIGQVIIDKNPSIETVVNKTGKIDTKFRTFEMEVIAGKPNFETTVSENGCTFELNFSQVYWNSRLSTEHGRIIAKVKPSEVVCDMMAGIGPFAVPLAKKGVQVFANDLNPRSYQYLLQNGKRNKCMARLNAFNMDGRDFVRWLRDESKPAPPPLATLPAVVVPPVDFHHVIMNLPASAVFFLDVFRGLYPPGATNRPYIHCYGFARGNQTEAGSLMLDYIRDILGKDIREGQPEVHLVRNVSPRKWMVCVSFRLPDGLVPPTPEELAKNAALQASLEHHEEADEAEAEDEAQGDASAATQSKKRHNSDLTPSGEPGDAGESKPKRRKRSDSAAERDKN